LPTPGQTPLELDADVAAAAVGDEATTYVPAIIMVAIASGSADFRSPMSPLQNIPEPPHFHHACETAPTKST
jgi:hypothetical protein